MVGKRFGPLAALSSIVPGLLLCGRSGSGRTSISKAVMRRLREDRKIFACKFPSIACPTWFLILFFLDLDTLYVDFTKYVEERIPVLRSLFQFWLNLAKWHRPSIIVFDNLERVVPAEVEVSLTSQKIIVAPYLYTSIRIRFDRATLQKFSSRFSVLRVCCLVSCFLQRVKARQLFTHS